MLEWLREHQKHFPPPLPEHAALEGACATYIFEKSDLSRAKTTQYLQQLEQAGLVIRSRHGKWTFYSRNEEAIDEALDALTATLGGL